MEYTHVAIGQEISLLNIYHAVRGLGVFVRVTLYDGI